MNPPQRDTTITTTLTLWEATKSEVSSFHKFLLKRISCLLLNQLVQPFSFLSGHCYQISPTTEPLSLSFHFIIIDPHGSSDNCYVPLSQSNAVEKRKKSQSTAYVPLISTSKRHSWKTYIVYIFNETNRKKVIKKEESDIDKSISIQRTYFAIGNNVRRCLFLFH